MKNLLILLIMSPLSLFGQRIITITLVDNTTYKGEILQYSEAEIKLIAKKRNIITIAKADIVQPENLEINLSDFITTVKSTDGNVYKGELLMEDDKMIMLKVSKHLSVPIEKSNIVFRTNQSKKRKDFTESTIYMKDGNQLKGEIVEKTETHTMINLDDERLPQKIKNENIMSISEEYKAKKTAVRKVLIVVGILYVLPSLFAI